MTDVVEAMARAIDPVAMRDPSNAPEMVRRRKQAKDIARAAIRACRDAGGLVVGKMPGEKDHMNAPPRLGVEEAEGWGLGYSRALAAVRAAAVEVE